MTYSRRQAIVSCTGALLATLRGGVVAWARPTLDATTHPEPRPGIDASRVLKASELAQFPEAVPVFDLIRQIPQIADGIRCQCDCKTLVEYRSLLTCFEGTGMATHCDICQAQAKVAFRLHKEGRSLAEIRRAIDLRFG